MMEREEKRDGVRSGGGDHRQWNEPQRSEAQSSLATECGGGVDSRLGLTSGEELRRARQLLKYGNLLIFAEKHLLIVSHSRVRPEKILVAASL